MNGTEYRDVTLATEDGGWMMEEVQDGLYMGFTFKKRCNNNNKINKTIWLISINVTVATSK